MEAVAAPGIASHSVDALWESWSLAEMGAELALYIWATAPPDERAAAHGDYLEQLAGEERAASALEAALAGPTVLADAA